MGKKFKRKQQGGRKKSTAEYWWRGGGRGALPSAVPYGVGHDPNVAGKSYKQEVGKGIGGGYGSYFKEGLPNTPSSTLSKRYELGTKFLHGGWYNPYLKAAVTDPLTEMAGVKPGGEGATAGDLRQFQTISPEQEQFMGEAYETAKGGVGGEDAAILPSDAAFASKFATKAGDRAIAHEQHQSTLEAQDIAEQQAKDVRKGAKTTAALERKKLGVDVTGKKLSSEAAAGASGFAYSGPQARAEELLREEGTRSFEDIKRGELKSEKAYDKSIEDIEFEREKAERDWQQAELNYATGLQDIYSGAGDVLQQVQGKLGQIMDAHRAYGEAGAGRNVNVVGAFGPQSFGEVDLKEQKEFEQQVGRAETFMDQLEAAQGSIVSDVAAGILSGDENVGGG